MPAVAVRDHLLDYLAQYAYDYRPSEPYRLVGGSESPEYLDCKVALSHPSALLYLGVVMLDVLQPEVVALGGLTMGADPLAITVARASAASTSPLRWFSVRRFPKPYGRQKIIEGCVQPGEAVAVVDEVVTSGRSTLEAIHRVREFGLQVVQVITLVDREVGGLDALRHEVGASCVSAIYTKTEIHQRWMAKRSRLG